MMNNNNNPCYGSQQKQLCVSGREQRYEAILKTEENERLRDLYSVCVCVCVCVKETEIVVVATRFTAFVKAPTVVCCISYQMHIEEKGCERVTTRTTSAQTRGPPVTGDITHTHTHTHAALYAVCVFVIFCLEGRIKRITTQSPAEQHIHPARINQSKYVQQQHKFEEKKLKESHQTCQTVARRL